MPHCLPAPYLASAKTCHRQSRITDLGQPTDLTVFRALLQTHNQPEVSTPGQTALRQRFADPDLSASEAFSLLPFCQGSVFKGFADALRCHSDNAVIPYALDALFELHLFPTSQREGAAEAVIGTLSRRGKRGLNAMHGALPILHDWIQAKIAVALGVAHWAAAEGDLIRLWRRLSSTTRTRPLALGALWGLVDLQSQAVGVLSRQALKNRWPALELNVALAAGAQSAEDIHALGRRAFDGSLERPQCDAARFGLLVATRHLGARRVLAAMASDPERRTFVRWAARRGETCVDAYYNLEYRAARLTMRGRGWAPTQQPQTGRNVVGTTRFEIQLLPDCERKTPYRRGNSGGGIPGICGSYSQTTHGL